MPYVTHPKEVADVIEGAGRGLEVGRAR
jgi:hypothetical protein